MPRFIYMVPKNVVKSWTIETWSRFVDFELFDQNCTYSKDCVFMYETHTSDLQDIRDKLTQGYRVLVDSLNEHYVQMLNGNLLSMSQRVGQQICWLISGVQPASVHFRVIASPYWYWIAEQYNFREANFTMLLHRPTGKYHWLCTMNLQRSERDYLYNKLVAVSQPGLLSYRDRNIFIADDYIGAAWQRRINPEWLADTYYTIVPESYVQENDIRTGISITERDNEFVCEKTLKPLAGQHPFLLVGTRGNLQHVRDLGFETFPELFDESYDYHFDWRSRVDAVIEQVQKFDPAAIKQPIVLEKLKHNQDRFFDQSLTDHFFASTIVEPVCEWLDDTA